MPSGLTPVGGTRLDFSGVGNHGSSKNFITVTDAAGLRVETAAPATSESAASTSAVASLSTVADAASTALQSLTALSSSVSQISGTGTANGSATTSQPYLAPVGGDAPKAGTDATVADFGSITVNGVTTALGSVQAPYMSSQEATTYVANAINANTNNTVLASVDQSGLLQLTSKDGKSAIEITSVGGSTTGIDWQQTGIGFQTGTFGSSVTASYKIDGPYFEENFARTYAQASTGQSQPSTAPAPAPALATAPAPEPTSALPPAPASAPAPATVSAGEVLNKGQAKKQGIEFTAEPPTAPQTATSGSVQLAPAPVTESQLAMPVNGGGNSPSGNAFGLIGQVAHAHAAQQGGQTASDVVSRQSTKEILDSLPEPQQVGPSPAASAAASGPSDAGGSSESAWWNDEGDGGTTGWFGGPSRDNGHGNGSAVGWSNGSGQSQAPGKGKGKDD